MKSRLDLHQTHLTYGLDFMADGLNRVTLKVIVNIYKGFIDKKWIFLKISSVLILYELWRNTVVRCY